MFRIAFQFVEYSAIWPALKRWRVTKCHRISPEAESYTLPIKVSTDHGRKRLLVLSRYRFHAHESCDPLQILNVYLSMLPEAEKVRRAAEMAI